MTLDEGVDDASVPGRRDRSVQWHQTGASGVRNPEAWLASVVTRRAIDRLRSASAERERYVGDWLPEPVFTGVPTDADHRAELASDISNRVPRAPRAALLEVVAEDATWTSDGGGRIPAAHNVRGAARIARFQVRLARKLFRYGVRFELVWLNGEPAIATWVGDRLFSTLSVHTDGDRLFSTLSVHTDGERLTAFYSVLNPEKLRHAGRRAP